MNSDRKLQRSCHVDQFTFHKERPISNAYSRKKTIFPSQNDDPLCYSKWG